MEILQLIRMSDDGRQTLGVLHRDGEFLCYTMELPWKNNEKQVSCIPCGSYLVKRRFSDKYKAHFQITDVPGRSFILIHTGNYNCDTLGCVLPGMGLADINKDGLLDVTSSGMAMSKLLFELPEEFFLEIKNDFPAQHTDIE